MRGAPGGSRERAIHDVDVGSGFEFVVSIWKQRGMRAASEEEQSHAEASASERSGGEVIEVPRESHKYEAGSGDD